MNRIKEITEGRRGALGELSRKSGVCISTLSSIKTGTRTPCFRTATKIAQAAGMDVFVLFPEAERYQGAQDYMREGGTQ